MKILKPIFAILFIITISLGVVYLFNRSRLEVINRPVKIVKPENYTSSVRDQIGYDDVVEITGTPDLLHQVSQEKTGEVGTQDKIEYYYVALKEYGIDFVIRIKPGKLFAEQQTFRGKVTGLTKTDFGTRIKNSLNKPLSFQDAVNKDAAQEIDTESQEELSLKTQANFTSSTLLVMDAETFDKTTIYLNMAFWTGILSIFLITFFRKKIFEI